MSADLHSIFDRFCPTGEMSSTQFVKLLRDGGLLTKALALGDADMIFVIAKAKSSGGGSLAPGQKVPYDVFRSTALPLIAERRGESVDEVIQQLCKVGGPSLNGATVAGSIRLHDDKSTYTGTYNSSRRNLLEPENLNLDRVVDRSYADLRGVRANDSPKRSLSPRRISGEYSPRNYESDGDTSPRTGQLSPRNRAEPKISYPPLKITVPDNVRLHDDKSTYTGTFGYAVNHAYDEPTKDKPFERIASRNDLSPRRHDSPEIHLAARKKDADDYMNSLRSPTARPLYGFGSPGKSRSSVGFSQIMQYNPEDNTLSPRRRGSANDIQPRDLKSVFLSFCPNGEMSSAQFAKLCRDGNLYNRSFTAGDGDTLFIKAQARAAGLNSAPSGQKVPFEIFRNYLVPLMSDRRNDDDNELMEILTRISGPVMNITVPDSVRLHDDKSTYTGTIAHSRPTSILDNIHNDPILERTLSRRVSGLGSNGGSPRRLSNQNSDADLQGTWLGSPKRNRRPSGNDWKAQTDSPLGSPRQMQTDDSSSNLVYNITVGGSDVNVRKGDSKSLDDWLSDAGMNPRRRTSGIGSPRGGSGASVLATAETRVRSRSNSEDDDSSPMAVADRKSSPRQNSIDAKVGSSVSRMFFAESKAGSGRGSGLESKSFTSSDLRKIFMKFCPSGEMSASQFIKLLRESDLWNSRFNGDDAQRVFTLGQGKAAGGDGNVAPGQKITFEVFRFEVVPAIADKRQESVEEVVRIICSAVGSTLSIRRNEVSTAKFDD